MGPPQARPPEHGPRVDLSAHFAYDRIGVGYARRRRPDPRIAARIHDALGSARTVVNVGAGTGSYEPTDRAVVAVEPSSTMLAQRIEGSAPAVQGVAEHLSFRDGSFDAALCVLTAHHWADVHLGMQELRRVARRQVHFTFDVALQDRLWFAREYLPESIAFEAQRAPVIEEIVAGIGGAEVVAVPIPRDCTDGFLGAYWHRPEAYLDPEVQASVSTFASVAPDAVDAAVRRLGEDLDSGAWHRRFGDLLDLEELDLGYRLVFDA